MLRGSAIIFVAILKHFALGDKLRGFMWVGVWWNVVSIILVGATVILSATPDDGEGGKQKDPLRGVLLILAGAFVQSLQYAFEEKVMSMEVRSSDAVWSEATRRTRNTFYSTTSFVVRHDHPILIRLPVASLVAGLRPSPSVDRNGGLLGNRRLCLCSVPRLLQLARS